MKRIVLFLLCVSMMLSVMGCSNEGEQENPQVTALQVGFGRADISPKESVPLYGYADSNSRWSTDIVDPIYTTCTAFSNGDGNTFLIFHLDWTSTFGEPVAFAKKDISKATGIPASQMMVASTHQHSGPYAGDTSDVVARYNRYFREQMLAAAQEAIADLKPAEVYSARTTLKNINFVRHYTMDDGSVVGDNFGSDAGKTYTGHVHAVDNEMQILRFKREGAKDVVMVNWQTHPHRGAKVNYYGVTSDIIGTMRDYMEANMDCLFTYYTGASGNVNPNSRIDSENVTDDYIDQGHEMGKYAVVACDNMVKLDPGKIQILKKEYTAVMETDGIQTQEVFELNVLSIGDLAYVWAPYEMFDTNGKQIKEGSPFDMTFICTMANTGKGYVAEEAAYAYGGYEVEYRNYVKGTAENLVSEFLGMLKQLHTAE